MLKKITFYRLVMPAVVFGGTVKRWVDSEGIVHFGDTPPATVGYKATPIRIRPLTGGKGLSVRQLKLAKELDRQALKRQKRKFKAEKEGAKHYRAKKKVDAAYRKGKLIKGMSERQIKDLLGEPDFIFLKESKKGQRQKWRYKSVKVGEPEMIILENGLYSSHRNKKAKK